MRQHAGWSKNSRQPQRYLHFFGNESSEQLLEAKGLINREITMTEILKPKQCPNCKENNKVDAQFCAKCRMVLSYQAYSAAAQEKQESDSELQKMKGQLRAMFTVITAQDGESKQKAYEQRVKGDILKPG